MKQLIITLTFLLFITLSAAAQTTAHHKQKATAHHAKAKNIMNNKTSSTNNRKIYVGKDGQAATVTGHEATPVNGSYTAIKKDSTLPSKPKKH